MSKIIVVFTGKSLKAMQEDGGSGHWTAKSDRIKDSDYVLMVRNDREKWADKVNAEHGQAFMIGKVSGCVLSHKHDDRRVIKISEYSLLPDTENFKEAWSKLTKGQRFPVAYLNDTDLLTKLNLNIKDLVWTKFESLLDNSKAAILKPLIDETKDLATVISEAKQIIAHAAGVETDKIDIQIKF